MPLLYDLK